MSQNPKKNKKKKVPTWYYCVFVHAFHIKTLTWVIKAYDTKRQVDVRTGGVEE
jgi:hypothetical protein